MGMPQKSPQRASIDNKIKLTIKAANKTVDESPQDQQKDHQKQDGQQEDADGNQITTSGLPPTRKRTSTTKTAQRNIGDDKSSDTKSPLHHKAGDPPIANSGNSPGRALYLLKIAKSSHISGDKPSKTLDYAWRAAKMFEALSNNNNNNNNTSSTMQRPSLEMVTSLHIVAAAQCRMGKYEEAVEALEQTLQSLNCYVPEELVSCEGREYCLAAFAGYMQLGDNYTKLGKQDRALESYRNAVAIQKQVAGELDPQVGETCRYVAEAFLQALRFDEAEELCKQVLRIHAEHSPPGCSMEEAVDRRLMALILSGKGDHELALEHLILASTAMAASDERKKQTSAAASVDASIGDCYAALGRYDEAVFSYNKALSTFKQLRGEDHSSVASMYVSLGDLALRTGKMKDARSYCENALRIYGKQPNDIPGDELAAGLTDIAGIFEALSERQQAVFLLQKALESIQRFPGEKRAAAGIEAQMGVLYYMMESFDEAFSSFSSAVAKLKASGESRTSMLGVLLNQTGLALFELQRVEEAVDVLEEAKCVLVEVCGVHHANTIAVCSNLAGGYDALGRVEDAIDLLDKVVCCQEERLGTVHPDVVDERLRLEQMLRETRKPLVRKTNTLEELLMLPAVASGHNHYRFMG